ncbi:MAG: hypothetical protein P8020_08975 [Acidobacteriota bacterium]
MRARKWLGILQLLVGIGAVPAGLGLVMDPSGASLRFRLEWLEGTPFSNFLIPGLILMIVNGFGSLAGSVASLRGWRRAGEVGLALGIFLTLWIILQVYWIGLGSWLQPTYFVIGRAVVVNPSAVPSW